MKTYYKPGCWNAICSACNEELPISEFYLHSNGKPRKQCKECHYKRGQVWKKGHKEQVNQKRRSMSEEIRERSREASKDWRKRNLAYDAFRARTYRARKIQAVPNWADLDKIKEVYKNCPEGFHVDHVVPLKGKTVCGLHVVENLQYLPALENIRKRNFYEEFL